MLITDQQRQQSIEYLSCFRPVNSSHLLLSPTEHMPRYRRFRSKLPSQVSAKVLQHWSEAREKSKGRQLSVIKLVLSASIPVMIAIFTVVSYVQQMQINEESHERDERLANATRDKDLEIANLTRLQDQMTANITRLHDLEIANLTQIKDWEIAAANLHIANETKIQDRQIAEENRNEDRAQQQNLHYETVYSKYIDDISTILHKQTQNQSAFSNVHHKMLYIRRKTLVTLRSIDSERRSQLFVFLYENNLLPNLSSPFDTVSLASADLRNIVIEGPVTGPYEFSSLSLQCVNLINATFRGCTFRGATNFTGSIMINVTFVNSVFEGKLAAYEVNLFNASFVNCTFKKGADFNGSDLRHARFVRSNFQKFSAGEVDLRNGSFLQCRFSGRADFLRSPMNGTTFWGSTFEPYAAHRFDQVSLDYSDFRDVVIRDAVFRNSTVAHSNFSSAYLRDIKFTSKVLLVDGDFRNATLVSIDFSQTNLTGTTINVSNKKNFQLDNVVLPDGTWSLSKERFVRNGNAEDSCSRSDVSSAPMDWKQEIGSVVSYYHTVNEPKSVNATMGMCYFRCGDKDLCKMKQLINLSRFKLFIDTNEVEYTVSATFGTDSECAQDLIEIGFSHHHEATRRQFSNPYMKSSGNGTKWQQVKHTATLTKADDEAYCIRVTFRGDSTACYVDNIELQLSKKPS